MISMDGNRPTIAVIGEPCGLDHPWQVRNEIEMKLAVPGSPEGNTVPFDVLHAGAHLLQRRAASHPVVDRFDGLRTVKALL